VLTVDSQFWNGLHLLAATMKLRFVSNDRPLKLVPGPQCPVVEVAARLALLNEFSRVENSVVGLKPQMTIRLPAHLRAWAMSDETRVTLSCGNDQRSQDGIHTVLQTLSPLKYPIYRGSHIARQIRFTPWKDADPDIPILKQAKAEYAKLD
jgi:hypothetical protein